MAILDLVNDCVEFLAARLVDAVVVILARDRSIRRDDEHVEFVDVVKLVRFGLRGAGHAGELVIKPEIILNRDRGERLRFAIDLHAFLGFDGLMQSVAPAAARHQAAGEFVDDDDFVFLDHVLHIFFEEAVGAEQLRDVVNALGLRVAVLLPFGFLLFLLVVRSAVFKSISVNR